MLTRPANSNTLVSETHSHDEVGFRRAWTRAEQDELAKAKLKAMRDAWNSPEMQADLADLRDRCRAAARPKITPVSDEQFDHDYEVREGWAFEGERDGGV